MTGQGAGSTIREHIWLVALYEQEARADELLERLTAIGIDTSEATTVRVEIDDQLRTAKYTPFDNGSALSPITRSAVSWALAGGAATLVVGLTLYALGLLSLQVIEGLFSHALAFVLIGSAAGGVIGAILAAAKQNKRAAAPLPQIPQVRSEGFLVAVKMHPSLAERAEQIARGLGAKEILL